MPSDGNTLWSEFEGYVRRHEADANAHAAERHRQNSDWAGRIIDIEKDIVEIQRWQTAHDIAHAGAAGELKGILGTIRTGFVIIGALITAFGGAGLALFWTSHH